MTMSETKPVESAEALKRCMPCVVGHHEACNIRDFRSQCCCQRGASHD